MQIFSPQSWTLSTLRESSSAADDDDDVDVERTVPFHKIKTANNSNRVSTDLKSVILSLGSGSREL
jgi:hypothetical protein